jgi:hypothetical protein
MFSGSTECSVVYRNQFIQFRFRIRHDHSVQNLKLFSAHNEIEAERHIVQNLKFSSGYFIHRHPIYTAKDTDKPYEQISVQDTSVLNSEERNEIPPTENEISPTETEIPQTETKYL